MVITELGTVGLQGMGTVVEVAFGIVVASMEISLIPVLPEGFSSRRLLVPPA